MWKVENAERKGEEKAIWGEFARIFGSEKKEPSEAVVKFVPLMKERDVKNVADIGCGYGRNSIFLAKQGFNVTAIDFSNEALEILKKNARAEKVQVRPLLSDSTKLAVQDSSFDAVISTLVLELHKPSERKHALHEIERVLKPGGIALITGNFSEEEAKQLKEFMGNFNFIQPDRVGRDGIRMIIAEKKA
ncbi:MAG: class I SAM-dependent methyltransferase [Candidatus Micrarchaeia archaeon]